MGLQKQNWLYDGIFIITYEAEEPDWVVASDPKVKRREEVSPSISKSTSTRTNTHTHTQREREQAHTVRNKRARGRHHLLLHSELQNLVFKPPTGNQPIADG